jgi:hypothetical protein
MAGNVVMLDEPGTMLQVHHNQFMNLQVQIAEYFKHGCLLTWYDSSFQRVLV